MCAGVAALFRRVHACECVFAFFSKIVTYDFRRSSHVYYNIYLYDRRCSRSRNATNTLTHIRTLIASCRQIVYTLTSTHAAIVCVQLIMTFARRASQVRAALTATYRDGIGIIYYYVKVYIYICSVRRRGDNIFFVYYYYYLNAGVRGLPPITERRITAQARMTEIVADPEDVGCNYDNNTYHGRFSSLSGYPHG